jgi:Wax ester synthase-like Acyl-CoA acyltransferase domain
MQRLSGLDASFLYFETQSQPLHVCSILELDTSTMPDGYTFDRLRDELAVRIKAMPQFREKLADSSLNLDHPVWVDDNNFDVLGICTASACRHPVGGTSCPRSAVISPLCRWTARGRCGRCGSSKGSPGPMPSKVAVWR